MKFTSTLIKVLIFSSLIGGGIYVAKQQGYLANFIPIEKWEKTKEEIQGSVKGITDNITDQTEELGVRTKEVSGHVSNVLSSYIKPANDNSTPDNESAPPDESSPDQNSNSSAESTQKPNPTNDTIDKPIYEEAIDYGRYLYCQQVVKDYQQQHQ